MRQRDMFVFKKIQEWLDNVEIEVARYLINSLLEFIKDESRSCIIYTRCSSVVKFLTGVIAVCKREERRKCINQFPSECVHLIEAVIEAVDQMACYIKTETRKLYNETMLLIYKKPKFKRLPSKSDEGKDTVSPLRTQNNHFAYTTCHDHWNCIDTQSVDLEQELMKINLRSDSTTVRGKRRKENESEPKAKGDRRPDGFLARKMNWKNKLLEDLSVPVKCDKALKMMIDMGWKGGALGVRGEGITEPLMPALHIVAGVGLGHTIPKTQHRDGKENIKQVKKGHKKAYHLPMLEAILQFVTSNENEKEIEMGIPVCGNGKKFLYHAVQCFQYRSYLNFCGVEETATAFKILEEMKNQPNLYFAVEAELKSKKISFKTGDFEPVKKKRGKKSPIPNDTATELEVPSKGGRIRNDLISDKAVLMMQKRMSILNQILELTASGDDRREIKIEGLFNPKLMNYISDAISKLNKGTRAGSSSEEMELADAILSNMDSKYLLRHCDECYPAKYIIKKINKPSHQNQKLIKAIDKKNEEVIADADVTKNNINNNDRSNVTLTSNITDDSVTNDISVPNGIDNSVSDELNSTIILNGEVDAECEINVMNNCNNTSKSELKSWDSYKTISIVPLDYPTKVMNIDTAIEIQNTISRNIDITKDLPLLKCHGIQNGGLTYSCHNKKSYEWLTDVIGVANFRIEQSYHKKDRFNISIKMNSFIDCEAVDVFRKLELYNVGLRTNGWRVIKLVNYIRYIVIYAEVDVESLEYVKKYGFSLYAGIDMAEFSIVWD